MTHTYDTIWTVRYRYRVEAANAEQAKFLGQMDLDNREKPDEREDVECVEVKRVREFVKRDKEY